MKCMLETRQENGNSHDDNYNYNYNSINASPFLISFDTYTRKLYLQDETTTFDLTLKEAKYNYDHSLCVVPFGYDKRAEKENKQKFVLRKQRKITQQIKKSSKQIEKYSKKNNDGSYDEKIDKLRQEIEQLKVKEKEGIIILDNENPDLVIVPTLFGTTFEDDQIMVTFIDQNKICIENKLDESVTYTVFVCLSVCLFVCLFFLICLTE